jgi:hypothetical protein
MGYSLSWLAVRQKSLTEVCGLLGLVDTGQTEEEPESGITAAALPNGWLLITSNSTDLIFSGNKDLLKSVSTGSECIACFVEEHVMCSDTECWRDGSAIWSVMHAADQGLMDLETKGKLPPQFTEISQRLIGQQQKAGGKKAEVDHLFDIPLELAQSITGYRHDVSHETSLVFHVLNFKTPPKAKGFFRRILGF